MACMDAVEVCSPMSCSLLCRWHSNNTVLRYCLPAFVRPNQLGSIVLTTNDILETNGWVEFYQFWYLIMTAPNKEAFKDRVLQLEKKYLPNYLAQVGYIQTLWFEQCK
jgi:hypothetical protein